MSIERQIAKRREELNLKIQSLRSETMKHSHISRTGVIKIDDGEPLAKLNAEITETENQIKAVDSVTSEMGQLYHDAGVESFQQLNTLGKNQADIVRSAAPRCWQLFTLTRGQGASIPGRDRTSWLVGDIVALPEYQEQEAVIRKERDDAKSREDSLRETRNKLLDLFKSVEAEPTADDSPN